MSEGLRYFTYLSLHHNLFGKKELQPDSLLADALTQKMARTKDRIYRLLALIYPWKDIAAAEWTLQHGDSRSRASASEYLDNVLSGQLRKRIMPLLEDLPLEEKVRRGNVLIKSRPRDVEETLLQLINDDDQVVAAAAIDVVRQQQMWALADDIEHVLAHRDVRDWYVFEAASWALAEQRMPAERRRELWLEPLPAAELAGRLRHLPLFASVSVDELFRIASTARQVRHEPGSILLKEGTVPASLHLLLDGQVTATTAEAERRAIEPPAALGFDEALQGQPMRETMRTEQVAVTLVLTVEELRTLLADNTDLVTGLFATLSTATRRSRGPVQSTAAGKELAALAAGGLSPIEKVLALQKIPLFSRTSVDEMQQIAPVASTVTMTAGAALFAESAPPALWLILSGEVALTSAASPVPHPGREPATSSDPGDAERAAARPGRHRDRAGDRAADRARRPVRRARRTARAAAPDVRGDVPPRRRSGVRLGRVPAEGDAVGGAGRRTGWGLGLGTRGFTASGRLERLTAPSRSESTLPNFDSKDRLPS